MEIRRSIYGPPIAVALANKGLKLNLTPNVYFEVPNTPGLWRNITRPISFSLVVDDFCVKYIDKADADHLVSALEKHYEISEYCTGGVIILHRTKVALLKLNTETLCKYFHARLHHKTTEKYQHKISKRPQHAPYLSASNK